MEAVAAAKATAERARPSAYNYYDPLHQAGPSGAQAGVPAQGSQSAAGQLDEAKPSSASGSRASGFSARARKASALTVEERIVNLEAQKPKEQKNSLKRRRNEYRLLWRIVERRFLLLKMSISLSIKPTDLL